MLIQRYPVDPTTGMYVAPKESPVIAVGQQGVKLLVFALVSTSPDLTEQFVNVVKEGEQVPDPTMPFIGAVQHHVLGETFFVFQADNSRVG